MNHYSLNLAFKPIQVTFLPLVPPVALFLTKHPMVEKYDLSSVKTIVCAAAHLSDEIEKALLKRFPNVTSVRQGKVEKIHHLFII